MAANSYLIVGCKGDMDSVGRSLKSKVEAHLQPGSAICDFYVPQGPTAPKFGTFDNLIRYTDELQKHDSQTEGCLRRLERQWLEADPDAKFEIVTSSASFPVEAFLKNGWQWDETKYATQRSLQANVDHLLDNVQKLDDECRSKGQEYSDFKSQKGILTKRDGVTFPTRDLVDLMIPSVVSEGDFVETDHLTTVVVILARGQEKEFLEWYQEPSVTTVRTDKDGKEEKHTDGISPPQTVVPDSAKQFTKFAEGAEDKDGNTVWRVVLFKSCKDKFASLARANKFTVRDFTYKPSLLNDLEAKREQVEAEAARTLLALTQFCRMAWSDVFSAWMHIKAMRVYVECVLNYGVEAKTTFAGYIIAPKDNTVTPQLRQALAASIGQGKGANKTTKAGDDEEEDYPYVSLGFAPRAAQIAA